MPICVQYFTFCKLSGLVKIWFADEEFEASGKLYLSRSADHYLTMEDAVTVGEILLSKLKAQESDKAETSLDNRK